jgi:hypothetical protein
MPPVTTQTTEIMVIVPNRDATEVTVEVGTTIGELAVQLGLPTNQEIAALDEMSTKHPASTRIGIDAHPAALSFVYRLAGA